MKTRIIFALGLAVYCLQFLSSCQREVMPDPTQATELTVDVEQRLAEQFHHYEAVAYDHDAIYAVLKDIPVGGVAEIAFPLQRGAAPLSLHLERNGVAADDLVGTLFDGKKTTSTGPLGARTFQGSVAGGGIASITVSPTMIAGLIEVGGETWNLEPIQKYDPLRTNQAIAYREQDMVARAASGFCETASLPASETERAAPGGQVDPGALAARCWQIETFAHGDYRYLQTFGGNYNSALFYMVSCINNSSARLSEIDIHLFVPSGSLVLNTTQDNMSFDAITLLSQVRVSDNANFPNAVRDITLFFTGRNMTSNGSSGVAGIAWQAVLCANKSYSYGVAETINGVYNTRVQTHEIAHMLGAAHDGACNQGLMYPSYNSSCAGDYPSTTSATQISTHISNNSSCTSFAPGC
jgi:hypothetical protein